MKDIDEIKKLSPEERVRKLKELKDSEKEKIDLAEELLKKAEEELEESHRQEIERSFEEIKEKTSNTEIPNLEESIKEQVEEFGISREELSQNTDYQNQLSTIPQQQLEKKWDYLNQSVQAEGGWTYASHDQKEAAMNILYAEKNKFDAAKKMDYTASEGVMSSIKTVIDEITGKYDRGGAP